MHQLVHRLMEAWERGDHHAERRAFADALSIDAEDRRNGGTGYAIRWFIEIAQQHPKALAVHPDLRKLVEVDWPTQCRAIRRGRRDYRDGYGLNDNPYDSYIAELAHECWIDGWQQACKADPYDDDEIDVDAYDEEALYEDSDDALG